MTKTVVCCWGGDNPPETLMGQRLSCVVVKKDRQHNCYTPAYPKKMLPTFYQTHLQKQLAPAQFILLTILLNLIQSEKQVNLERLARVFPYPITTESRRHLETQNLILEGLDQLGILPGASLYFPGVRARKTRPVVGFDIACKWKRNYQELKIKNAWFILTDWGSSPVAISAYKQRMGIEEIFRDCKTGGYNLEGSGLRGERLIKMILLLMAIVYT